MRVSDKGIRLIQSFEGCKLTSYICPAGILTIGWGCNRNVTPGMQITQVQADNRLRQDLAEVEAGVTKLVKVKLNQNQFDALCAFAMNCGLDIDADAIAEGLGDSTLLKKLNAGDYKGAALQFLRWNKANGRELAGLTRRRKAERELFLQ